jgi:hypothetical protein
MPRTLVTVAALPGGSGKKRSPARFEVVGGT